MRAFLKSARMTCLLFLVLLTAAGSMMLLPAEAAAEEQDGDADEAELDTFEKDVGQEAAKQILEHYGGEYKLPFTEQLILDEIFDRLVAEAERTDVRYSLTILNTRVANAFALPGGFIFITRGLLNHLDMDEQAIAAVLGHEIAHVEERHGVKALARRMGLTILVELGLIFFNVHDHEAIRTAGAAMVEIAQSGWSREAEYEADELGAELAVRAGFDPMGAVYAIDHLKRLDRGTEPLAWFRTHPSDDDRQSRLLQQARSHWDDAADSEAPQAIPQGMEDPRDRFVVSDDDAGYAQIYDALQERYREWLPGVQLLTWQWHPEGSYVALAGQEGIWLLDRYGRGETPWRGRSDGSVLEIAWDPSGQRLAYVLQSDNEGAHQVFVGYLHGDTDLLIAETDSLQQLVWSDQGIFWQKDDGNWRRAGPPALEPVVLDHPVPRVLSPTAAVRPELSVEGEGLDRTIRLRRPPTIYSNDK